MKNVSFCSHLGREGEDLRREGEDLGREGVVVKFVSSALAAAFDTGCPSPVTSPWEPGVSQCRLGGVVLVLNSHVPPTLGPLRSMVEDLQSEESDDDDSSSGEEAAVKANPVSRDSRW